MVSTRSMHARLDVGLAATMAVDPPTEPGGVHPEQRLADRAQRLGQVRLGHHDALEEVGGLADDDGVDVVHRHVGIGERPVDGLAEQARQRDVAADRGVLGLADTDDGDPSWLCSNCS